MADAREDHFVVLTGAGLEDLVRQAVTVVAGGAGPQGVAVLDPHLHPRHRLAGAAQGVDPRGADRAHADVFLSILSPVQPELVLGLMAAVDLAGHQGHRVARKQAVEVEGIVGGGAGQATVLVDRGVDVLEELPRVAFEAPRSQDAPEKTTLALEIEIELEDLVLFFDTPLTGGASPLTVRGDIEVPFGDALEAVFAVDAGG